MKLRAALSFLFSKRSLALGALAALAAAPAAQARNDGAVSYSPGLQIVQGDMPLLSSYTLTITSPSTLASPAIVNLDLSLFQPPPEGVSNSTALSFVAIVPNVVAFTGPNQSVSVQVISTVPLGNWAGSYVYQIKTSGWPVGLVYTDGGAFINSVFSPPPVLALPEVVIALPVNQSVWTMQPGASLQIPYEFVGTTPDGSPIISLTGGVGSTNLLFSPFGIGTPTAIGNGTFTVSQPGIYTVHAETANPNGIAQASVQIRVNVNAGPPGVVINTPAPGTIFQMDEGGSVDVPFTFTGTSQYGGIRAMFAQLDGVPITFTPSGYGNLVATGSGTMHFTAAGEHDLTVIAVDDYGNAQTSTVFSVVVVVNPPPPPPSPPPTVVINDPLPDDVFELTAGGSLTIPFAFTGSSTGTPINNLTAVISTAGTTTPINFFSTGMNTQMAIGTASLVVTQSGTYTLSVTATNSVGTAMASQNFTVTVLTPPPPPPPPPSPGFTNGEFTTYSIGGWMNRLAKAKGNKSSDKALTDWFIAAYPNGFEIGIPGSGGFSMKFVNTGTGNNMVPASETVSAFIKSNKGPGNKLTSDLLNPTTSPTGTFGTQVVGLRLGVNYNNSNFGNLKIKATGTWFDGKTISQALAIVETVLGGGANPTGMSYGDLTSLVTELVVSFDEGAPSSWTASHLTR